MGSRDAGPSEDLAEDLVRPLTSGLREDGQLCRLSGVSEVGGTVSPQGCDRVLRALQTCSRTLPDPPLSCPPLLAFPLDLSLWCGLWAWPGPWLRTFWCVLPCLPNSAALFAPLSPLCPSPVPPSLPRLRLAQGRLSEEIEKLRQEVDQLKGRGGPFVDGVHPRY